MKIRNMTVKDAIKYRSVWMGIAMLWVMFFHSDIIVKNNILMGIKAVGYGGVDIFLFASGIGNYFSYFKDESPLNFLRRRVARLAPIHVPFMVAWIVYNNVRRNVPLKGLLGNILGIQGFTSTGTNFNWYLTVLVICYLLTPYFAKAVKDNNLFKNMLLIVLLILISMVFFKDTWLIICFTRLPIYVIGMMFAKYSDKKINTMYVVAGAISCIIGSVALYIGFAKYKDLLWPYGIYWYPFILITPFFCYTVSIISSKIEKYKPMTYILNIIIYIGHISYELYLMHIFLFSVIGNYIKSGYGEGANDKWIKLIIFTFPCAIALHYISIAVNRVIKIMSRKKCKSDT